MGLKRSVRGVQAVRFIFGCLVFGAQHERVRVEQAVFDEQLARHLDVFHTERLA